jgi:hypothetical protein
MGMLGQRRQFVFVVGDEGAVLCLVRGRDIARRLFASTPAEADEMRALLESWPRLPVTVMVDVLDISLQRETVPPLPPWQLRLVLRRRMAQAFPGFPYTGAMFAGREDGGRRDRIYMIAGVAASKRFDAWMRFLASLPNRVEDIALLPVEAADIIDRLSRPLGGRRSAWRVLVTRERTSGFRQVVCRDGAVAFSRLTGTVDADAPAEAVAAEIEEEFRHTVDYVKRLGFAAGDGLDLVIVVAEDEKPAVEACTFNASNLLLLTPFEAAGLLALGRSVTREEGYGDLVHALALVGRGKPRLRLLSEGTAREERSGRARKLGYWAAAALGAVGVLLMLAHAAELYALRQDIVELERQRREATHQVASLENEVAELPAPRARMLAELRSWAALSEDRVDPGPLIGRLGTALADSTRLRAVDWRLAFPGRSGRSGARSDEAPRRSLEVLVSLELLGVGGDRQAAVALGERVVERVRAAYEGFAVATPRLPVSIRPDETLRLEGGLDSVDRPTPQAGMEILITRPAPEARR